MGTECEVYGLFTLVMATESWLTAGVRHHDGVLFHVSLAQEKTKFKIKVWFLLNGYCLCTIVKLKNHKSNHPKLGISCISIVTKKDLHSPIAPACFQGQGQAEAI